MSKPLAARKKHLKEVFAIQDGDVGEETHTTAVALILCVQTQQQVSCRPTSCCRSWTFWLPGHPVLAKELAEFSPAWITSLRLNCGPWAKS